MASSQDTSEPSRPAKRRRLFALRSSDDVGDSSSLALGLENGELAGDTQTKDPGKNAGSEIMSSVAEVPPARQEASAPLEAEGRPPTGATVVAQGRPPTSEAEWIDSILYTLPLGVHWEIMKCIPSEEPAQSLPPKEMFRGMENCLKGHLIDPAANGDVQGTGEMLQLPSPHGYG